ncbi:MAG: hypothetical protein DLM55_05425 [Acidimicrobiales bacterium]|nr:MAG: hypothetical protein DLM55_05425 [Acidimicrobiales bacterium]
MLPTALGHAPDPTPTSSPSQMVGQRYSLREAVGSGGMGTVWRSHDELLRRDVAIKEVVIPPGVPSKERELLCERMLREARAAAALNHPAVVSIFDVVTDLGRPWIVMELLDARSIADIIKDDGPLPVRDVVEIGLAVLGALDTAHNAGVLHRDVKPGNILITTPGRVVLTDFGAARSPNDTPLTSTGLLLGSPQYIAPERARGRPFGPASDLFSLGSSLYAAVEGRPPFDRGDPMNTMTAVVCDPPDDMLRAGALAPILASLLAKAPEDRWDLQRTQAELTALLSENSGAHNTASETAPGKAVALRGSSSYREAVSKERVNQRIVARDVSPGVPRRHRASSGVSDAGSRRSASVRRGTRRQPTQFEQTSITSVSEQTNSGNTSGRHRRIAANAAERRAAKQERRDRTRNSSWRHREHKSGVRLWLVLTALLLALVGAAFAVNYASASDAPTAATGTPTTGTTATGTP